MLFVIIYALQAIYVYCIYVAEMPCDGMLAHTCSLPHSAGKLTAVGVFTPPQLVRTTNNNLIYCFVDCLL